MILNPPVIRKQPSGIEWRSGVGASLRSALSDREYEAYVAHEAAIEAVTDGILIFRSSGRVTR